jgi:hypothetical protein
MLNIGKLATGPGAGRYYVDQVAQGREDYYSGEGEAPGVWQGGGAAALGLSGEVSEQGIVRLLEGRDPATGELLGRPITSTSENEETPTDAAVSDVGRGGFRTCDLSRVKRDQAGPEEPPGQGRLF